MSETGFVQVEFSLPRPLFKGLKLFQELRQKLEARRIPIEELYVECVKDEIQGEVGQLDTDCGLQKRLEHLLEEADSERPVKVEVELEAFTVSRERNLFSEEFTPRIHR